MTLALQTLGVVALVTGTAYHSIGLYRHRLWFKKQKAKR